MARGRPNMSPVPASNICITCGGLPARKAAKAAARCSGYWPRKEVLTLKRVWLALNSWPSLIISSWAGPVRPIQTSMLVRAWASAEVAVMATDPAASAPAARAPSTARLVNDIGLAPL